MRNGKTRKIAAIAVLALAVVLMVTGALGMNRRNQPSGQADLADMRDRAVLVATGEGVVESYVAIAKAKAQQEAREAGGGMAAIREAVAKAEEEARNNTSANMLDYATADISALDAALDALSAEGLVPYYAEQARAQAEYVAQMEAAGALEDVRDFSGAGKVRTITPDPERQARYAGLYRRYLELYSQT